MAEKVTVKIDGKEYELKYNFNAIIQIEEDLGMNVFKQETWTEFSENMSASKVLGLVHAGISHLENPPSKQEIGKVLGLGDLKELIEKIGEAFAQAMPDEEE